MSFSTFIGFITGVVLFVLAIILSLTDASQAWIFLNGPSFVLVVGGTIAATFAGHESRYVWLALKGILGTLLVQRVGRNLLNREVGRIIRWGYLVQQQGIIALESDAKTVRGDEFLNFGVEMVVSSYPGEDVREILLNTAATTYERNLVQPNILRFMASAAPAFGMIGTLVGLIIMLDGLDPGKGNLSQLGQGLAVALNTTLYGILLSRLILLPAAAKLQQRQEIMRFRNELMAEGLALLSDRTSPRLIQDRMNSFLDPAIRFDIDRQMKKA
jgi:chemotaxis protein MotA